MTPQEYLEWEEQQLIKYEYIAGEVLAMTGGMRSRFELWGVS